MGVKPFSDVLHQMQQDAVKAAHRWAPIYLALKWTWATATTTTMIPSEADIYRNIMEKISYLDTPDADGVSEVSSGGITVFVRQEDGEPVYGIEFTDKRFHHYR